MRFNKDFSTLIGQTLVSIERSEVHNEDALIFKTNKGYIYTMTHERDCCESVNIEDICGELDWLLNTPILHAEESTNRGDSEDSNDSHTWTFYKISTINGSVDIRWHGESNGYYSESVSFYLQMNLNNERD